MKSENIVTTYILESILKKMRLNMVELMKLMMLMSLLLVIVEGICPNNCSGHGSCRDSVCECFKNIGFGNSESYGGADCSEHICFMGNPFSAVYSGSPSENGISGYGNVARELSVGINENRIRGLSVGEEFYPITLKDRLDEEAVSRLWKVSGLEILVED